MGDNSSGENRQESLPSWKRQTINKTQEQTVQSQSDKSYGEESSRVGRWRSGRSNGMMRGGLTEKVTFEQRPEGSEGGGCVGTWGKSVISRKKSQCKGPEVGSCLPWVRKSRWPVWLQWNEWMCVWMCVCECVGG